MKTACTARLWAFALMMFAPILPRIVAAGEDQKQSSLTDRITEGVYRVAQGEPAFEEKKAGSEAGAAVVAPNPDSPAEYNDAIRNFYRDSASNRWRLMISSPGWYPDQHGDETVGGVKTKIDLDYGDMYDLYSHYLVYGVILNVEARRGLWSIFADVLYMKMAGHFEGKTTLPPFTVRGPGIDVGVSGSFDMSTGIYELGGGYRFLDYPWGGEKSRKRISMDAIAGARYWRLWTKLDASVTAELGRISRSASGGAEDVKDWVDPFVGLRMQADVTEKIFLLLRGDVGGFGLGSAFSSEFSWKAEAGISYNPTPRVSMFLGFQVLDVDYEDGGFGYNIRMMGPVLGFGYTFGGPPRPKPAP